MPKPKHELTDKARRFVEEYAKDFNATQAAIRAGYSKRSAGQLGERLLKKDEVRTALGKILADLRDESHLTAKRVLEEIALVAFVRPGEYVNVDGSIDFVRFARENPAAIAELETDVTETGVGKSKTVRRRVRGKAWNKNESLRDLGRYFKLFQTDVRRGDVPKDATPPAPRAIHDYTTEELLEIVARGEPAQKTTRRKRR